MKQVQTITIAELTAMAEAMYGNLVKAVVDLAKDLLVVDADMHVDEEQYLLESGSTQNDLWGINLHPDKFNSDEFVEFDSMINLKPRQDNLIRGVQDPDIRKKIIVLVNNKVKA
jgi:uncharacterized protein DUF5674